MSDDEFSAAWELHRAMTRDSMDEAYQRFTSMCARGHGRSCMMVGMYLEMGFVGAPDLASGEKQYVHSCDLGYKEGCVLVAEAYLGGRGVDADPPRASKMLHALCDEDVAGGCNQLAFAYRDGTGVPKSRDDALAYYDKACKLDRGYCLDNVIDFIGTSGEAPQKKVHGTVTVGAVAVSGGSVSNASAIVAKMAAGFRHCYETGLAEDPNMKGTLTMTAEIGPNGEVPGAFPSSTGGSLTMTVKSCLAANVMRSQFAPPEGGEATIVFPMSLTAE